MKKLGLILLLCLGLSSAQAQVPLFTQIPPGTQTTPIFGSQSGTTGSVAATLTGASNRWTYFCGFVVTSGGTTAAIPVNVTVTGSGTTLNYTYVFVSTGQGVLGIAFPQCLASSAVNTNFVVTVPAGGAGTTVAVSAWGYLN